MDLYQLALVILVGLAISDLIVGVSNDAVNFLNSAVGSRVAPFRVIMIIASLGIITGVTFSSGMMEVARKGIFHPRLFTMPELMVVFLAVMLTDVVLLDLFNTYGLPTSTTVSIVFELLGAAVAVSLLKLAQAGASFAEVVNYINTAKALAIIAGILLSVVVAFIVGAIVQLLTRLLFTFDFQARLKRYGALWGGAALSAIVYFILIKGARGASFISEETLTWIRTHTGIILLLCLAACAMVLQLLLWLTRVNILKLIVLAGTFALAMAFAANDLVNFIGVPLAGISAYSEASASGSLTTTMMEALQQPVRSNTWYLLLAGTIMMVTLWVSRKARSVTKTQVQLGRQEEGFERFESTALSRLVVRFFSSLFSNTSKLVPRGSRQWLARRLDRSRYRSTPDSEGTVPSFDLIRAGVNLMVAAALISFATSLKLPLSTTYVTFMVAMGTSLSDQAWGRESAVYRVTGVLTVIGGWFFTAIMAFTVSSLVAVIIFFGRAPAVLAIACLIAVLIARTHRVHKTRERHEEAADIFNLRKIKDASAAMSVSFEQAGFLLRQIHEVLQNSLNGLFGQDLNLLRQTRTEQKQIQVWSNILGANIFKVLRLRQWEEVESTQRYVHTISTLQEISESLRDIVMRSHLHVANNHSGLLEEQIAEAEQIRDCVLGIVDDTSDALSGKGKIDPTTIAANNRRLRLLVHEFDQNQIMRIQDNTSKTRLSILFYSIMWDCLKIAENTTHLLEVFRKPETEVLPGDNDVPIPGNMAGPTPAPSGD